MVSRYCCWGIILFCLVALPASGQEKSKFDQLTEGKTKVTGLWTIYHSEQQMLVDFSSTALKKEYILIPSIAKGISRGSVLGGYSWGFGDDAIWAFKKSGEKLFVMQRNVRFKAKAKSPEADAVEIAYSDSILYSLPILTKSPSGGVLVDMTRIFMSDDQHIGSAIGPGFRFMSDRSTLGKLKGFEKNMQIRVNAVYSGSYSIETVPSPKGVQVAVHYSVSELPAVGSNGYKPRKADDRIGYFLTAIKDFSEKEDPEHFVRYINRWNLQKLDSSVDFSPPKEPIRFYMEKTVPVYLRPTVEAAFLEWNKAYEKLGFSGAIKIDLQPDDPDFDPENINYNTFRWITADAGFAMGPSRVDPRTGQILDADIIFDASFLDGWNSRWEALRSEDMRLMSQRYVPFNKPEVMLPGQHSRHNHSAACTLCGEMQLQMGFAAASLLASGVSEDGSVPKDLIHEGLKEVVMHEVGHTLGLRHNFKASTWKTLDEINDKESGLKEGTVSSVMDYTPANITIDKDKQGLYYTQTIGPYDYWAIEYGYKPVKSDDELKEIAAKSGQPELDYATDEDTRGFDPDPLSNRFDLGKDPLVYVRRQMEQSTALMPKIVDRTVKEGAGYQRARQAFGLLFRQYWYAAAFAARYPGGLYVSRDHKGDKDANAPLQVVEPKKQREAMQLLAESAFAPPAVDGETLNYMSASRWSHWGTRSTIRLDYAIHDEMLTMQDMILYEVLYPLTLERILDNEFKVDAEADAYTLAEHMDFIVKSIFSEWQQKEAEEFSNRKPLISSFRRNLQRVAITRLGYLISHGLGAPADARTLTRMHLATLKNQATQLVKSKKISLDDYSRAHLMDSIAQIDKLLNAELTIPSVN